MPAFGQRPTVDLQRTPDGRRLVVSHAVAAPVDIVWDVLTDTELWPEWGPSITTVESADRYIRSGSRGRVRVLGAVWLPFEITSFENYCWTWNVAQVPATGHFVEDRADGAVVGFELPVAAAGYVPVCRRACRRIGQLAGELTDSTD